MARLLTYFGFLLVLVSFALPFGAVRGEVSYQESEGLRIAVTWHGTDLVFGGTPRLHVEVVLGTDGHVEVVDESASAQTSPLFGNWRNGSRLSSQPSFVLAVLLLLGGMAAEMLVRQRIRAVVAAAVAFGTIGALLVGQWLVAWHYAHQASIPYGHVLPPAYGLWLALGALLVLGIGNTVGALLSRRAPTSPTDPVPSAPPGSG
jgi:hypothetical protein